MAHFGAYYIYFINLLDINPVSDILLITLWGNVIMKNKTQNITSRSAHPMPRLRQSSLLIDCLYSFIWRKMGG